MIQESGRPPFQNNLQNSTARNEKTLWLDYIDPESLDKEDPTKPNPLALLVESCDKVRRNLEQAKFSSVLRDLVCGIATQPTQTGQKRPPEGTSRHSPVTKMRRSHLHQLTMPPLLIIPPPQTEPVNLSSKSGAVKVAKMTVVTPKVTSPTQSSPLSTTSSMDLMAKLFFLGSLLPHLLKPGPQFCPPCEHNLLQSIFTQPPLAQTPSAFLQ